MALLGEVETVRGGARLQEVGHIPYKGMPVPGPFLLLSLIPAMR